MKLFAPVMFLLAACTNDRLEQPTFFQRNEIDEYHYAIGKAQEGDDFCGGFLLDHPQIMISTLSCFKSSQGLFWFNSENFPRPARTFIAEDLGHGLVAILLKEPQAWRVFNSQEYYGWDYVNAEIHMFGLVSECLADKSGSHECGQADIPEGHPVTMKGTPVIIGVNIVDDKPGYTGNIVDGRFVPVMNFYSRFLAVKDKFMRRINGDKYL